MRAFLALVKKDLKLFFGDRRALVMTIAVPIALASFMGLVMGGSSGKPKPTGVPLHVVDLDQSILSQEILTNLFRDASLRVTSSTEQLARESVRTGKSAAAIIIPKGFGDKALEGLFGNPDAPLITVPYDPSRSMEADLIKGILAQHTMQTIMQQITSGQLGKSWTRKTLQELDHSTNLPSNTRIILRDLLRNLEQWQSSTNTAGNAFSLKMPFQTEKETISREPKVQYNGFTHAFAGLGVQFVLMAAIEFGVGLLQQRRQGIWKRFRSAPLSRQTLLGSHLVSNALISFLTLLAVFGFSMLAWGVRIQGSIFGFVACCAAIALFSASVGLLIGALGKSPQATRGVAIMVVLIAVMLGGAWVPAFIFPQWLQTLGLAFPTRWALDGLAAMTWRGLPLSAVLPAIGVLLASSVVLSAIAVACFKWDSD